jgi:hypothetical protein
MDENGEFNEGSDETRPALEGLGITIESWTANAEAGVSESSPKRIKRRVVGLVHGLLSRRRNRRRNRKAMEAWWDETDGDKFISQNGLWKFGEDGAII